MRGINNLWLAALCVALSAALSAFVVATLPPRLAAPRVNPPDLVEVGPGAFSYRVSGDFTRDGKPVRAPVVTVSIKRPLAVMRHQVSTADYWRCVEAEACPAFDRDPDAADLPLVKVSWRDAQAYAAWLSRETRTRFRLPTDEEWAHAAADRFQDDPLPERAYAGDPGQRSLAIYEVEASRNATDRGALPFGSFGANRNGLMDIAGNVWEWTDTCFARVTLDARDEAAATLVNCGVRVVEGRHRTYMPDFIRDARAGGCSTATPPSNLGFRLVRDDHWVKPGLLAAQP